MPAMSSAVSLLEELGAGYLREVPWTRGGWERVVCVRLCWLHFGVLIHQPVPYLGPWFRPDRLQQTGF